MKGPKTNTFLLLIALFHAATHADPYTSPSTTTISSARQLYSQGYNILGFYKSLKDLYLADGFDMGNKVNQAILEVPDMSAGGFNVIIEALEATRKELRDGEIGLKALTASESLKTSKTSDLQEVKEVLKKFKLAIRDYTKTTDDDAYTLIDQFVNASNPLAFLDAFNGLQEQPRANFIAAAKKALSEGVTPSDIKRALVGAARVIQNVGEPNYLETIEAVQGALNSGTENKDLEPMLNAAQDLTLRFRDSKDALQLIQLFLSIPNFSKSTVKFSSLLEPLRFMELQDIQALLKLLISMDPSSVAQELQLLSGSQGQKRLAKLAQWKKDKDLKLIALYLSSLKQKQLAPMLKDLQNILRSTEPSKYTNFLRQLLELTGKTRDGRFSDFYDALTRLPLIAKSSQFFATLSIASDGFFDDYIDTLRMLTSNWKPSEDVRRGFLSGVADGRGALKELGIDAVKIHSWIYSTRSLDPTVQILKASGSLQNLKEMLEFHTEHTVDQENPDNSEQMIMDIIKFMEMDGKFVAKRNKRLSFKFSRNGSANYN